MLTLGRKQGESIVIGDAVVTVVSISGSRVTISIEAPRDVTVHRGEVAERIKCESELSAREGQEAKDGHA